MDEPAFLLDLPAKPCAGPVRLSQFLQTDDGDFLFVSSIKHVVNPGRPERGNVDGSNFGTGKALRLSAAPIFMAHVSCLTWACFLFFSSCGAMAGGLSQAELDQLCMGGSDCEIHGGR